MKCDVVIVGGGAAGLMCAITAGKRGRSVTVLEHAARLGNKIFISGGGRCNFTNTGTSSDNYVTSGNPHFCKSALARYTPGDFIALVEQHGIHWHEKKLGQLFCDVSSRQIVDLLQTDCANANVNIRLNCRVNNVRRNVRFVVESNLDHFECDSLVIATGGLSFPKLGATPFGYRIAEQFGLKVVDPRPGLVPLVLAGDEWTAFKDLSGVSLEVTASVRSSGASFRENLLITHRGLSGPAILQISNYLQDHEAVHLDLIPGRTALDCLQAQRTAPRELRSVLGEWLPQRFAEAWSARFAPSRPLNQISTRELETIASRLNDWIIQPTGNEDYPKAEVTLGGVDTTELSSKTMESRKAPGLYFIGEVVDVTGWLGGYNFQWAWASGHAAGEVV
jgi:predicted Rossmann fold flavoprotein